MKLDGYIRVSRVNGRNGDSFISPERQREAIEAWAQAHNAEIIGWHEELDRSGGEGKRRPVFEALLERIKDGESGGVVVWKYSRFGRSLIESALRIRTIEQEAGGAVRSATEGQDKLTRNIMLVIAEDELDRITDSWADSQRRAIDRGVHIGAAALGLRRTDDGTLEPNDEAPIVTEAFRIAATEGVHQAGRYLAKQVPDKRWRTSDVRRLLRNRVYLGEVRLGELVKTGAHEPLTTEALWELAQTEPRGKRTSGKYPLTQIARCSTCGNGLVGALQSVGPHTYRRMRCSKMCPGGVGSVSADKLEAFVKNLLRFALSDWDLRSLFSPDGLQEAQEQRDQARADRTALRAKVRPSHPDFERWLAESDREVEEAEAAYNELASQDASAQLLPSVDELDDPEQFARALRAMVSKIVVQGGRRPMVDRVEVYTRYDGHDVLWPTAALGTMARATSEQREALPEVGKRGAEALAAALRSAIVARHPFGQ